MIFLKDKKYSNNNKDPYGYDFVQTIAHVTNIDEQRKQVNYLENIKKDRKSTNNGEEVH